jgi:hypothetical protein
LTVGLSAPLTVIVIAEVELPLLFVAVSVKPSVTGPSGAVKVVVADPGALRITAGPDVWDQVKVGTGFPVAVPARVTSAPEATV